MNIADITITSLETITAFDVVAGTYLFTLDELQSATIANTQDTEEITGKGGRRLAQLKRNKAVTVSGTNGLVSGGLLAAQAGSDFEVKATTVMWADYLIVSSNKAKTTYVATGTEGAEIRELFIRNSDGTIGEEFTQGDTTDAGVFTYDPETKEIEFGTKKDGGAIDNGTEIVAYYDRAITEAGVISNKSDVYSKKASLYIDAIGEDKCANVYRIQFFVPKADFSGEFSIEMGDNQTVHEFEAESLAGACVSKNADALWTYTIFGVNDGADDES